MGKKSTGESPYVYEGGSLKQQLQYILWEEAARNLLSLMEGKGTGSYQPPQRELLAIRQSPWDSQDGSAFKVVGSKRKGTMCWGSGVGWGVFGESQKEVRCEQRRIKLFRCRPSQPLN